VCVMKQLSSLEGNRPRLTCSWTAERTFFMFSKETSFVPQTTEDIFRSREHSLKAPCCLPDETFAVAVWVLGCKASGLVWPPQGVPWMGRGHGIASALFLYLQPHFSGADFLLQETKFRSPCSPQREYEKARLESAPPRCRPHAEVCRHHCLVTLKWSWATPYPEASTLGIKWAHPSPEESSRDLGLGTS